MRNCLKNKNGSYKKEKCECGGDAEPCSIFCKKCKDIIRKYNESKKGKEWDDMKSGRRNGH